MIQPTRWSVEQLRADAQLAKGVFRDERLDEPLESYSAFFEKFSGVFTELVAELEAFAAADDPEIMSQLMSDDSRRTALRYITAPPISEDDLKILADAKLTATALRANPEAAARVRSILLRILDEHRFPWVKEGRSPTENEREVAVVASAALVAARKVETQRRGDATQAQELAVRTMLDDLGLQEVPRRPIRFLEDAPGSGEYCGESLLGGTKADVVIRLRDRRILAVECKASNSEVNSYKRLVHEAAGKAGHWIGEFGTTPIVPAAVLAGVYSVANLLKAQEKGLHIFWSHRLDDLKVFVEPIA